MAKAVTKKPITTQFFDLCRLCLQSPGFCNVFDKENLPQSIFLCTGVNISIMDTLPHKICDRCYRVVTKASRLRTLAMNNDNHLKILFNENEDSVDKNPKIDDNVVSSHYFQEKSTFNDKTQPITKETIVKKDKAAITDLFGLSSNENLTTKKNTVKKEEITNSFGSSSIEKSTKIPEVKKEEPYLSIRKRLKFEGDEDFYSCNICKKTFSSRKKQYLHSRHHDKKVICPFDACQMKFTTKGDLKKHVRSHTGEKPYSCTICKSSFSQKVSLRIHEEQVHNIV